MTSHRVWHIVVHGDVCCIKGTTIGSLVPYYQSEPQTLADSLGKDWVSGRFIRRKIWSSRLARWSMRKGRMETTAARQDPAKSVSSSVLMVFGICDGFGSACLFPPLCNAHTFTFVGASGEKGN